MDRGIGGHQGGKGNTDVLHVFCLSLKLKNILQRSKCSHSLVSMEDWLQDPLRILKSKNVLKAFM